MTKQCKGSNAQGLALIEEWPQNRASTSPLSTRPTKQKTSAALSSQEVKSTWLTHITRTKSRACLQIKLFFEKKLSMKWSPSIISSHHVPAVLDLQYSKLLSMVNSLTKNSLASSIWLAWMLNNHFTNDDPISLLFRLCRKLCERRMKTKSMQKSWQWLPSEKAPEW